MDFYKSMYSILLVIMCQLVIIGAQEDALKFQCYDCTYFKGNAEMNPNCKVPESSTPVREGCEICAEHFYKNATRVYIRRSCTRICEPGSLHGVTYQDLQNVQAVEYCCTGHLCNAGSGSRSRHQSSLLVLSVSFTLVSVVFSLLWSHLQ